MGNRTKWIVDKCLSKIKKYILYRLHILFFSVYLFIAHFHNTANIISRFCRDRSSKRFDIRHIISGGLLGDYTVDRSQVWYITHTYILNCCRNVANSTMYHCGCFFFFISQNGGFYRWRAKALFCRLYIVVCNILFSSVALITNDSICCGYTLGVVTTVAQSYTIQFWNLFLIFWIPKDDFGTLSRCNS